MGTAHRGTRPSAKSVRSAGQFKLPADLRLGVLVGVNRDLCQCRDENLSWRHPHLQINR